MKKSPVVLWFLVAGLAAISACDAKEPSNPTTSVALSPYPVLDSGVWADWYDTPQSIIWIDNNRVLFKTVKDNDKGRVSSGPFNLSIWDTTTNIVMPYTEYASSLAVCYREGYIYYALSDEKFYVQQKHWRHFSGEFGNEKPYTPPAGKDILPGKLSYYDSINCRISDNQEIVSKIKEKRGI